MQTNPESNADSVKKSDLKKFYNEGHSVDEVAEKFNVESATVMEVLDLDNVVDPNTDEFNVPKEQSAGE